jgi:hypothetical protein
MKPRIRIYFIHHGETLYGVYSHFLVPMKFYASLNQWYTESMMPWGWCKGGQVAWDKGAGPSKTLEKG